jgi:transposase InsO family protein
MLALFGLFGLFSATFLAARLIPAQSEAVLAGRRSWEMRWHAELPIFEYINGFYHPQRRHSAFGWKSPVAFERKVA